MSFSRPERDSRRWMNLTAMIDLMFILVIFFVTASSFREEEQLIDIKLAATQTGAVSEPTRTEMVINITRDGTVLVGQRVFSDEELRALLRDIVAQYPNERVIIRGDKAVVYERVLAVMDAARSAGIRDANLSTTRKLEEAQ